MIDGLKLGRTTDENLRMWCVDRAINAGGGQKIVERAQELFDFVRPTEVVSHRTDSFQSEGSGWAPIATAPKNERILVYDPDEGVSEIAWWDWCSDLDDHDDITMGWVGPRSLHENGWPRPVHPTHWHPLPECSVRELLTPACGAKP